MVAVLLLAYGAPLRAKDKPQKVPIRPVALRKIDGNLFVKGEANTSTRTTPTSESTEEERIFEEGIEVNSDMYFYHPNLVELLADLRLGASQQLIVVDENESKTNGTLQGYNVTGLFLKEKPVTFRAFASQTESLRDRDFAQAVKVTDERQGAEIRTKGSFPASLLAEMIALEETGDRRTTEKESPHLRFEVADRRDSNWLTQLSYDHEDIDETRTFGTPDDPAALTEELPDHTDEVILSNQYRFGPKTDERQHSLIGQVRHVDRTGFLEREHFSAEQRLDLVHSKTLSSFYQAEYDEDQTAAQTNRIVRAEIGLLKKFYESLDVALRLEPQRQTFAGGSEDRLGGHIETAYRKKTPIGKYSSSVNLGEEVRKQESSGHQRLIQDESVTLDGISFSRLARPGVRMDSVVVRNANRGWTYVKDIDYIIRATGAYVEISRRASGEIEDGQELSVDYQIVTGEAATVLTDLLTWGQRLQLPKIPVALYTNYDLRDENLCTGDEPGNMARERTFLAGIEFDYKKFVASFEHEIHSGRLLPGYVTNRVKLDYRRTFKKNLEVSVGAHAEKLKYQESQGFGPDEEEDFLDTVGGHANLSAKLGANAMLRFDSDIVQSSGRDNRMLFHNKVSLEWKYRKVSFSIEGHFDVYEQDETTETSTGVMFNLKRNF